ncbi:hypothetical protein PHISP_06159 [Aspergillus sp. HF37]|nr:hypothetical protein PHISP_06159 [Aspergillus sp. HF37]
MPPPKSASVTPDEPHDPSAPVTATEQQLKARADRGVNVEDYLLPRSLTLRLAKSVLPPNTSIQKDAVLAIQKAATVFVSYLSSHANDATLKRTVAPTDVFGALSEIEFDAFRARLEKELEAHSEMKAGKRRAKKGSEGGAAGAGKEEEEEEDAARDAKRVKTGLGGEAEGSATGGNLPVEEDEGDETQEEPGMLDENEDGEDEEDGDGDGDGEEDDEHEQGQEEEEDINRVEDLDDSRAQHPMDPDAASDHSDSDADGPSAQLRNDVGFG